MGGLINTAYLMDKKEIFSWTLYDFANSAFTTLVVTFIYSTYFTKSIAPNEIDGSVPCQVYQPQA